jgi:hypothetical protein
MSLSIPRDSFYGTSPSGGRYRERESLGEELKKTYPQREVFPPPRHPQEVVEATHPSFNKPKTSLA